MNMSPVLGGPLFATPTLVELSIPLLAVTLGCAIPIIAILIDYFKGRRVFELYHQERMAAIEKGRELPPLPEELFNSIFNGGRRKPRSPRRRSSRLLGGLIWTMSGLGATVAIYANQGADKAAYGLIPIGVGLSHLIYYFVEGKKMALEAPLTETNSDRKSVV